MAVYTAVTQAEIDALLARYDIGRCLELTGIAEGVENSNYAVETDRGRFILTIYEKRVRADDLPFFLGLMDHLAARGVECPVPVKDLEGRGLQELCGKPAALVTYLEGRSPRRLTMRRWRALGEALAGLHEAGRDFALERRNMLAVDDWRPLFESCLAGKGDVEPDLVAEIEREIDGLERDWPRDLPQGVIHADLFPDNVFFDGDRVSGIIDFYFACNDLHAYDLAICLNAWCFEPVGEFNITKARAMIAGYQARRKLAPAELASLPTLCRGAAMRFLLTRLYDWINQVDGALVKPKDPGEYLRKLRFHRHGGGMEALGLG